MNIDSIKNKNEKIKLAKRIAERVMRDGEVIGFGSGSTSYLAAIEIAKKAKEKGIKIKAIPTSIEIENLCKELDIPTTTLLEDKMDWCFDGADEVDGKKWLIKGKGAAMFREKLNIVNCKEVYILVDSSKMVRHLGEKELVPVECYPTSINYVKEQLEQKGAEEIHLRKFKDESGTEKNVVTDNGNYILDVKFAKIYKSLEKELKQIIGVVETGLFLGYNVTIVSC